MEVRLAGVRAPRPEGKTVSSVEAHRARQELANALRMGAVRIAPANGSASLWEREIATPAASETLD